MKLAVRAPSPEFSGDIALIASIFFGRTDLVPDDGSPDTLVADCRERREGDLRFCSVRLSGPVSACHENSAAPCANPLGEKRQRRRQIKLAAYFAFKEGTGISPPWGALTGIRPTRLVYEGIAAGRALGEACRDVEMAFDLSAVKAGLLADVVRAQGTLPVAGPDAVDVYVGIPFCPTRCRYCSFISAQVGSGSQLLPYVEALGEEIRSASGLIREKGLAVRAFYMGGGTPTALPAPLLRRVLAAVSPLIAEAAEATVEAGRPDSVDREKLRVIADAGVRRISVNPQTMFDETLRTIGRLHTRAQTEAAYSLARDAGFEWINMDLIAGLPGENEDMFGQTLAWAASLRPENMTVHTLCIKRSSDMHLWNDALPSGETVSAMLDLAARSARLQGLFPYYLYRLKHMAGGLENVGYALPGRECLYNVDSMEDTVSVLALGAGGVSKRVYPGRERIVRAPNVKDIAHYLSRAGEMALRKRTLWADVDGEGQGLPVTPSCF